MDVYFGALLGKFYLPRFEGLKLLEGLKVNIQYKFFIKFNVIGILGKLEHVISKFYCKFVTMIR